ncbi:MAG: hypothetical protein OEM15_04335 [Myxococcales bacterium]|nr:hypothetical protein [Myxococcales bacterium]MDH3484065.1 hypothetical protein [Myxococcales bacterium]
MKYVKLIAALAFVSACGNGEDGLPMFGDDPSCNQRLAFDLLCPGDISVGATGQVTVQGYTASNINQLSFGAAGGGNIDPPAFQVPEFADSSTNIPEPPYVFTFTGLTRSSR